MAHALAAPDQAWLLGALPAGPRRVLQGLLIELRELGIPPDAALLEDLQGAAGRPVPPRSGSARLEGLPARRIRPMAQLLQRESPRLTARLLAMRAWPWQNQLLAEMEASFARALPQEPVPVPAAALEAALCDAVLSQLEAETSAGRRDMVERLRHRAAQLMQWFGGRR
jgi:hypothetical protein